MLQVPQSEEAWAQEGAKIGKSHKHLPWRTGDWLLQGRLHVDGWLTKAEALTGLSQSYLLNMVRAAEAFPEGVRSYDISWGTHMILLREPDAELRQALVQRAVAEQWTQHDAKKFFGAGRPKPSRAKGRRGRVAVAPVQKLVHVECPECHHRFPVKGNKVGIGPE